MDQSKVMPITSWQIGHAPSIQRGVMKLAYLSQTVQSADAADDSPVYGLTADQMRAMAAALLKAADQLDQITFSTGH